VSCQYLEALQAHRAFKAHKASKVIVSLAHRVHLGLTVLTALIVQWLAHKASKDQLGLTVLTVL